MIRAVIVCGLVVASACGTDSESEERRVDIVLAGCDEPVTGQSLLIRAEGRDAANGLCLREERCIEVLYANATLADFEATLKAEGFPIFDLAAEDIDRITIGLSTLSGCPLEIFTAGCGSAPVPNSGNSMTITLQCSGQLECPLLNGC